MELYGKTVFHGIAIGTIQYYKKNENKVTDGCIDNIAAEIRRYEEAKAEAVKQLHALYEKALTELGEANAKIFDAHILMLEDADYNASVYQLISEQNVNAQYAVAATGEKFVELFANIEDDYFRERQADVKDVTERVVTILGSEAKQNLIVDTPVILVADELTPSETVQMDQSKLLALVTRLGSINSHTAILAGTMGIPALVGIEIDESWNGKIGIVDGYEGKLIVSPEQSVLESYAREKTAQDKEKQMFLNLKGKQTVTKSGQNVKLYANIISTDDLSSAIANDAEGIGLFRSEFLYLEKDCYPTEEEQFQAYKKALEMMNGKKVVIRTLDIGADKRADYFGLDKEDNPALGYRAVRICLTKPEIFRTQLRALFRASAYGNLAILYPMIISVDEVRRIKEISKSVKAELAAENIAVGRVEEGIMIETPAAALISDALAKEADFFSIGTNDLTQYTLAIDRQNEKLALFYNPRHPAILRMIRMVCDHAHKAGIAVGICGELGADVTLTETFLKMGIDELSVSPGHILPVRKAVREIE